MCWLTNSFTVAENIENMSVTHFRSGHVEPEQQKVSRPLSGLKAGQFQLLSPTCLKSRTLAYIYRSGPEKRIVINPATHCTHFVITILT